MSALSFVFLGLSITSSWGNGHATTYRGLLRELSRRGNRVLFLERERSFYAENRDLPNPPYCRTELYESLDELRDRFSREVQEADVVVLGSYVPDGVAVADWVLERARGVTTFYDIDTPVTLRALEDGSCSYVSARQVQSFDLYLSFTGGPTISRIEKTFGARAARPLYCSVDPELYFPEPVRKRWDLGYLGTYSADRQDALERLLIEPARKHPQGRFAVAGAQYPDSIVWPANVARTVHLPPTEHRGFYNAQRFTLNVTRRDMVTAGFSPSVRMFEAAACGVPILSDNWPGIDQFFEPKREIVLVEDANAVLACLRGMSEERRVQMAERARSRILAEHTAAHRAETLEEYVSGAFLRRKRTTTSAARGAEGKTTNIRGVP
jgi:spore maturation protein CgeB